MTNQPMMFSEPVLCCSHADSFHHEGICEYPMCQCNRTLLQKAWDGAVEGMGRAEENAEAEWMKRAKQIIADQPIGSEFLAEDLVDAIESTGLTTHTRKALGPVIRNAARDGLIVKTGEYRPALRGHCRPMPVWKKTKKGN